MFRRPPRSTRPDTLVPYTALCRSNGLLGGGINLVRDPRGGRNFEYISEDPLLSGSMGAEAVRGAQSVGVVSTVKHFSLNSNETNRHSCTAQIDEAAPRQSDRLAFQIRT